MIRSSCAGAGVLLLTTFLCLAAWGGEGAVGRLVASPEPGWPQFRGPRRDGVSDEKGLLGSWPEGGPRLLWKVDGLGRGYSSPIVVEGSIYITGDVGDECAVFAFGLDGQPKWRVANGQAWKRSYPGARTTCTYSEGRIYVMNAHGRTACLNASDGKEVWAVDVVERFEGTVITWGLSECLLVDGGRVIVTPGGRKALMAALDKKTGETVWTTEPLAFTRTYEVGGKEVDPPKPDFDRAGYAPPILFEIGGRRLIARSAGQHIFCADADTGKLVWKQQVYARHEVIGAIPVLCGDGLFFAASDAYGGHLYRIHARPDGVRLQELWETPVDNCHGSFVFVDGHIYGSGYRRFKPWACLEAATGKMKYQKDDLDIGAPLWADGRLYALSQAGTLALLKPTEAGFETCGQIRVTTKPSRDCWAHPVICDGRLYLRYHDTLWCYDVRQP